MDGQPREKRPVTTQRIFRDAVGAHYENSRDSCHFRTRARARRRRAGATGIRSIADRPLGRHVGDRRRRTSADAAAARTAGAAAVHGEHVSSSSRRGDPPGDAGTRTNIWATAVRELHEPDAGAAVPYPRATPSNSSHGPNMPGFWAPCPGARSAITVLLNTVRPANGDAGSDQLRPLTL